MEEQNLNLSPEKTEKSKTKYWKFLVGFLGIILSVFILLIAGNWGWQKYRYWKDMKVAQKAEEQIKKWQQEDYERAMADTYGGKTPQETLQMYIEAVEKGDYELASKYFIGDYQEKELKRLKNSKPENVKYILNILRKVKIVDLHAQLEQMYEKEIKEHSMSESKEDYVSRLYQVWDYDKRAFMETKIDGYDFSVSFKKYPNDIWKIIEI